MGLRDEFADALDSIRDFHFNATRVSQECLFGLFLAPGSATIPFTVDSE